MINLPETSLKLISSWIVLTNSVSFLWRKLSESSTVDNLVRYHSVPELVSSLRKLLQQKKLNENDQTAAYCFAVSLLLKNKDNRTLLCRLEGIEKLFWIESLFAYVSEYLPSSAMLKLQQRIIPSEQELPSSNATQSMNFNQEK